MNATLYRAANLAALAIVLVGSSAFAINEQLSFSQANDGSLIVNLSGQTPYCGTYIVGTPTLTISGNQITVVSATAPGECPPPPPGFIFPPPTPYTVAANAGHLPDGTFDVTWEFTDSGAGNVIQRVSSVFVLFRGSLVAPLPVLPPTLSALLLFTLAVVGVVTLRRQSSV